VPNPETIAFSCSRRSRAAPTFAGPDFADTRAGPASRDGWLCVGSRQIHAWTFLRSTLPVHDDAIARNALRLAVRGVLRSLSAAKFHDPSAFNGSGHGRPRRDTPCARRQRPKRKILRNLSSSSE